MEKNTQTANYGCNMVLLYGFKIISVLKVDVFFHCQQTIKDKPRKKLELYWVYFSKENETNK